MFSGKVTKAGGASRRTRLKKLRRLQKRQQLIKRMTELEGFKDSDEELMSISTPTEGSDDDDTSELSRFALDPGDELDESYDIEFHDRLKAHKQLCSTWNRWPPILSMLNKIPKDREMVLAYALNDLPEWARLKAFSQLKSRHPSVYARYIEIISEFQKRKDKLDPNGVFPWVATTASMPLSGCQLCGEAFEEGQDIHWMYCRKHPLHNKCLRAYLAHGKATLTGCGYCYADTDKEV
jgi:hypothetical protein